MRRKSLAGVLAVAAVAVGLAVPGGAIAKIAEVDVSCTNPAGATPNGQQPSCQNDTLTQESENQNPSGHAPPGQN